MSQNELPREIRKALIGTSQLINQAISKLEPHQKTKPIDQVLDDLRETNEAIRNFLERKEEPNGPEPGPDEGIKSSEQFGQDGTIIAEQP